MTLGVGTDILLLTSHLRLGIGPDIFRSDINLPHTSKY
jgi:hypothetical protein